jgi:hypothetical protein
MTTARSGNTATLLADERVLVAGGIRETLIDNVDTTTYLASAELYDPTTGTFSPTGSMATVRNDGTATLLSDGRVLIAGGLGGELGLLASAELYDPATGTFSPTGSMVIAVQGATATSLSDGRVLIAGGSGDSTGLLASAELYDPKTGTFSPTGSMTVGRAGTTATLLSDGHVLVAGGGNAGASAELYDPATGTFSQTGSMTTARAGASATVLSNGRVLVAGGGGDANAGEPLASAELYNPASGTFSSTGSMVSAHSGQFATRMPDGRILIAGGETNRVTDLLMWASSTSAELYDPTTGKFRQTGSTAAAHDGGTATLLADGRVLVVGGYRLASAELFRP